MILLLQTAVQLRSGAPICEICEKFTYFVEVYAKVNEPQSTDIYRL